MKKFIYKLWSWFQDLQESFLAICVLQFSNQLKPFLYTNYIIRQSNKINFENILLDNYYVPTEITFITKSSEFNEVLTESNVEII